MISELKQVRDNLNQSLGQLAEFAGFNRSPEFLIFPIFSNICYQNVDFRVTNGDENRFIMA